MGKEESGSIHKSESLMLSPSWNQSAFLPLAKEERGVLVLSQLTTWKRERERDRQADRHFSDAGAKKTEE